MNAGESKRLRLVHELLDLKAPLKALISELSAMGWDYTGPGVALTASHLVSALRRYVSDEVCANDIESWANAVEGREDVDLSLDADLKIEEVLHELANPLLTRPLDKFRATQLVSTLAPPV